MASVEEMFRIEGDVVVITGAAGLLGRQHADVVASFGGKPVLLDLNGETLSLVASQLWDSYGVEALTFVVDITDEAAVESVCAEVLRQCCKIDALVNNAANNPKVEDSRLDTASRLEGFSLAAWNADIGVGLTGSFLCSKHFGAAIFDTSMHGTIVNISSDLGLISPDQRLYRVDGVPEESQPVKPVSYSVAKTGLIGLTRYLATYWTRDGRVVVRCNAICPGGIENGQADEFLQRVEQRIPMGRMAQLSELRGILIYLLSSASAYTNGAVIPVDGGRSSW